jgi:hypothetical protein
VKIADNNSELLDYSKRLDTKLRDLTAKKEAEIENIKKVYARKVDDTNVEGEGRFISSIKKNDDRLVGASRDFENKLNYYKENLEKTQKNIALEENAIRSDHSSKLESFENQHQSILNEKLQSANDNQNAIREQIQNKMQSITDKARTEKDHLENSTREEVNALSGQYNQKEITADREYRATLDKDLRLHQADINFQRTELKKVMDQNTEKNKRLETEKILVQTKELNFLDNHQKDVLSQKQSDFKVRYENLVKEHDSLLSELKGHFEADVKKMVKETADQKRIIANRTDDQFYRVTALDPHIAETEKVYQVSLNVPEHEKENVHLSVHGRGVKMTLTRRFTDSFEDKDGSTNKSTRNNTSNNTFNQLPIITESQRIELELKIN